MFGLRTVLSAWVLAAAALFAEDVGVRVNGVDVRAGGGAGWTYANSTLTLSGAGPFTLAGTNETGSVKVKVSADASVTAENLVLHATQSACAFQITAGKSLALTLRGANELRSGSGYAGLQVPAKASLVIRAEEGGSLLAVGGSSGGAGIGSSASLAAGSVTIRGGRVTANGGEFAAGIGGGRGRAGGNIVIAGGTVEAHAEYSGEGTQQDLGGGNGKTANAVAITGGSVVADTVLPAPTNACGACVWRVAVTGLVARAAVTLGGLESYGGADIWADARGTVQLWLPDGEYAFTAAGARYAAYVNGGPTTAVLQGVVEPVGVTVDGVDLCAEEGDGWTYAPLRRELRFTRRGTYVLSGTNTAAEALSVTAAAPGTRVRFAGFDVSALGIHAALGIAGGTVALAEVTEAVTITGGSVACSDFACAPSNGVARVWPVTVGNLAPGAPVSVTGLAEYDVADIHADAAGRIHLWLPDGDYLFRVDGTQWRACVTGQAAEAEETPVLQPVGVRVNGIDIAYGAGPGWVYAPPELTLDGTGSYALAGTNVDGRVQLVVTASATLTCADLVLEESDEDVSACRVREGAAVTIRLEGTNEWTGGSFAPAVRVPRGAALTIVSGRRAGLLRALGGRAAVGIGGGDPEEGPEDGGAVTVRSGTLVVEKGRRGVADIGGGDGAEGACVTIAGGSVDAETIEAAPVDAMGRSVHPVRVTGLEPGSCVAVTGLGTYGAEGLLADEVGEIHLWLPEGEFTFHTPGWRRWVRVTGADAPTTAEGTRLPAPTRFYVR